MQRLFSELRQRGGELTATIAEAGSQAKENARCQGQRAFCQGDLAWEDSKSLGLAGRSLASNAMDVRTVDTEVVQFAVGHAAEFGNSLTVLAPVVERASEVHFGPLS